MSCTDNKKQIWELHKEMGHLSFVTSMGLAKWHACQVEQVGGCWLELSYLHCLLWNLLRLHGSSCGKSGLLVSANWFYRSRLPYTRIAYLCRVVCSVFEPFFFKVFNYNGYIWTATFYTDMVPAIRKVQQEHLNNATGKGYARYQGNNFVILSM